MKKVLIKFWGLCSIATIYLVGVYVFIVAFTHDNKACIDINRFGEGKLEMLLIVLGLPICLYVIGTMFIEIRKEFRNEQNR